MKNEIENFFKLSLSLRPVCEPVFERKWVSYATVLLKFNSNDLPSRCSVLWIWILTLFFKSLAKQTKFPSTFYHCFFRTSNRDSTANRKQMIRPNQVGQWHVIFVIYHQNTCFSSESLWDLTKRVSHTNRFHSRRSFPWFIDIFQAH